MSDLSDIPDDDGAQSERLSPGLDALAAQAEALESGAVASAAGDGQAAGENNAAELLEALTMARVLVSPMMAWWPEFHAVWCDATLRGVADAGAQVMDRHGWTMNQAFTQFGPYIALAGATLPPLLVTHRAIKERKQASEAPPHERAEQAPH